MSHDVLTTNEGGLTDFLYSSAFFRHVGIAAEVTSMEVVIIATWLICKKGRVRLSTFCFVEKSLFFISQEDGKSGKSIFWPIKSAKPNLPSRSSRDKLRIFSPANNVYGFRITVDDTLKPILYNENRTALLNY